MYIRKYAYDSVILISVGPMVIIDPFLENFDLKPSASFGTCQAAHWFLNWWTPTKIMLISTRLVSFHRYPIFCRNIHDIP